MNVTLNVAYWRGEQFWLGKLINHPEIMSQGETLQEMEENLRDAWRECCSRTCRRITKS